MPARGATGGTALMRHKPESQQGAKRGATKFDRKTADADRRPAVPAAAAEAQPADDGNKVEGGEP